MRMSNPVPLATTDTPIQKKSYIVPEEYDLFLGGGRGPGKTVALLKLALRHVEKYQHKANILFLRTTHKALSGVLTEAQLLYASSPDKPTFNKQDAVFRWSNGGSMTFGQLMDANDYDKYQGHSYSLLILDEMTLWPTLEFIDLLQSNLRKKGVPVRTLYAANPGGRSHGAVAERFVFPSPGDMVPFTDPISGRTIVYIHGTYEENPNIDPVKYEKNLRNACRGDLALLKAWLEGDWRVIRGAYFSGALSEMNKVKWPHVDLQLLANTEHYLAHDHGTRRPFVCQLIVKTKDGITGPDNQYYPARSYIVVDEVSSAMPDDLEDGGGMQIPEICIEIHGMCSKWNANLRGVADDALFADTGLGLYSDHYRDGGIRFSPARKGLRKDGLSHMRELLGAARPNGEREDGACYIDDRCWYFWKTVPYLASSDRDREDLEKSHRDHAADALRYGLLRQTVNITTQPAFWDPAIARHIAEQNMRQMATNENIAAKLRRRGAKSADLAKLRGASGTQWRLFEDK
jgi:hypothetical protein